MRLCKFDLRVRVVSIPRGAHRLTIDTGEPPTQQGGGDGVGDDGNGNGGDGDGSLEDTIRHTFSMTIAHTLV